MTTEEKNTQDKVTTGTAPGGHVYKLEKAFTWEGRTYTEFTFQFSALTGTDMLSVEQEMYMLGEGVAITPEYSTAFTYRLAARAANVPAVVIEHLPFSAFNAVRRLTKNFMLGR